MKYYIEIPLHTLDAAVSNSFSPRETSALLPAFTPNYPHNVAINIFLKNCLHFDHYLYKCTNYCTHRPTFKNRYRVFPLLLMNRTISSQSSKNCLRIAFLPLYFCREGTVRHIAYPCSDFLQASLIILSSVSKGKN